MQLLVSVRSAVEAESALSGGADIIDAKEPGNGSLGPVSTAVLRDIMRMVPATVPLSIALGDCSHRYDVAQAIAAIPARADAARCYLKLGFAGVASPQQVRELLEEARNAAARHPASPRVVAVAYADADLTGSIVPEQLCRVAAASRVTAVLIDTQLKSSGNLLTRLSLPALTRLVIQVRQGGLLAALAGSLAMADLALVGTAGPDILGFRGAACTGGRDGVVSQPRVQQLRRAISRLNSGFVRKIDRERGLAKRLMPARISPDRVS